MMHWAAQYIGRPWGPPGSGLSCWEFARHVVAQHYGAPLPELPGEAMASRAWSRIAAVRLPAPLPVADGDLVLLRTFERSHVGVVVNANGTAGLLHADGSMQQAGSVVWQPVADALDGYQRAELWRRACPQ